uniref:Uncharacterized protein n=1 Tax=Mustela putorius furo TaxID=9669 RepID=M3XVZ7_MUSPF
MALWDTQPGSSVCSSPHLLPRTRIQVQVSSAEMIPVNPRRGMRDWDKAERQSTNDRPSSQSASGDQACWETPGATAECVPQSNPTEAEGAGFLLRVWNLWRPPLSQLLPSFVDYISRASSWGKCFTFIIRF